MRNIDRLFSKEYLPTNQDFLHASNRTIGVTETLFCYKGSNHHVYDVGGARRERKNRMQTMTDVDCLIFVEALGAFDSCLIEDTTSVSKKTVHCYNQAQHH